MKPLVLSDTPATVVYFACLGGWTVSEVVLAIRTTGAGAESDRSHFMLFGASFAGFALAFCLALSATSLSFPGGQHWPVYAGIGIFAAGFAYRCWAIHTLGRFFVFVVAVQEGQHVIDTGPYALVRHPSYLGLLACVAGLGLALDNWAALLACFLPPAIGFTLRMLAEERVLAVELGEPYREYMGRTRRLIPGVW